MKPDELIARFLAAKDPGDVGEILRSTSPEVVEALLTFGLFNAHVELEKLSPARGDSILVRGPHKELEKYADWLHRASGCNVFFGDEKTSLGRIGAEDMMELGWVMQAPEKPPLSLRVSSDRKPATARFDLQMAYSGQSILTRSITVRWVMPSPPVADVEVFVGPLDLWCFFSYIEADMLAIAEALAWTASPIPDHPHELLVHITSAAPGLRVVDAEGWQVPISPWGLDITFDGSDEGSARCVARMCPPHRALKADDSIGWQDHIVEVCQRFGYSIVRPGADGDPN